MKKFALLSVSDKTNIVPFAKELVSFDYNILATGNTAKVLKQSSIECTEISSLTGFPEIFSGRVKTLHPIIFGGILMRRDNEDDIKQADENKINPIDVVCVNLYPFIKVTKNPDVTIDETIENIDIGGPSLIRAAAKNFRYVAVLTDSEQYEPFLTELRNGGVTEETRKRLAVDAFSHTSHYDTYISNHLEQKFEFSPTHLRFHLPKEKILRYGENPHQYAAIYGNFSEYFEVLHGKEISYNNILDIIAAVELVEDLEPNSCTIIKHNNPSGAATGENTLNAYNKALACDPTSAFGGIVAFNEIVDKLTAEKLNEIFLEVIVAPGFTEDALTLLTKKKDRRLVKNLQPVSTNGMNLKSIPGGFLAQERDSILLNKESLKVVTQKQPDDSELEDLLFAWTIAKHTKSNAIVFVKNKQTLGIGAGQMSRIDSVRIASIKANEYKLDLTGSVAASDAFFPFPDGLLEIVKHGATAVIQPGGSIRDNEVIKAADDKNITMLFTGIRHFKH